MTAPTDNTPASIIEDALFDAALLQEGQAPNSEQLVRGMRILTDIINYAQVKDGLRLWLNVDTPVTLVTGTGTYTLGPAGTVVMTKPLRVLDGYWLSAAGVRRPLDQLSWDDYIKLPQVNQPGTINSYFVDKQQSLLSVTFWLPPDATDALGTGHVLLQTQVTNFTGVTDTMNFPIEWRMYLRWALADESATGQPQAIQDKAERRRGEYYEALTNWDVEDASTSLAPDSRGQYAAQRFR